MKFEHQISEGTYHTKGLRQKDSIVFIVQRSILSEKMLTIAMRLLCREK